jgi:hypothetical protein
MAETIIGLYTTEFIQRQGPGKSLADVEYATLEWVDWFNDRRIFEPIGNIPPVEKEANHYRQTSPAEPAGLTRPKWSCLGFVEVDYWILLSWSVRRTDGTEGISTGVQTPGGGAG